jgi:hypothetical protein
MFINGKSYARALFARKDVEEKVTTSTLVWRCPPASALQGAGTFPGGLCYAELNKVVPNKGLVINDIHIFRAPCCADFHNRSARVIHSQRRQAEASLCRSFESHGRLGRTDGVVDSDDFGSEIMRACVHGGRGAFVPDAGPTAAGTPAGCKEADPLPGPPTEFRLIVPGPCSH